VNTEPTENPTVLIVDDEGQMRRLLRASLERNGYRVVEASTGKQGLEEAVRCQPDLVVLDLGLPDSDGIEVLKRLREWTKAPVVVVSVRYHEDEKINALDNGADDYVTKPFSTRELLARLRVAGRHRKNSTTATAFQSGGLTVDFETRTVKRGDQKIKLTATEYSILRLFIQHAGKVLTHGQILRAIWGTEDMEKTGYLRVYMAYLREKLEPNPSEPALLVTEPGVGYRLVLDEPVAH
jgi:two-component system, OmpR family, KDP operon response regulator KdpE